MTLPGNTAAVNLKSGCSGIQVNNLDIENGQLNVNIGDKESVSLNNITAAINDNRKIDVSIAGATGDSVFNINGMYTTNLSITGSGKVILGKYRWFEMNIISLIGKIDIDASAIDVYLEEETKVVNLNTNGITTNIMIGRGIVQNLNINGITTNLEIYSGIVFNLFINGITTGATHVLASAGGFKTVQIDRGNTDLYFEDSCTITNSINLNYNNITITCPYSWIPDGKFIVQGGVTDKSTVKINKRPITEYGL
ncbi:hypothetical protein Ccar_01705 [Clostridium carboxidivorans P7]|uniref:Uncharacterized protein n=1 Tax=Clostridium carboxidivorans P7 TaxID=536227 RepID=C6PQ50_9CLOT|nr:hypothetical protein [Clostridium carboxidivorans]AKN29630.1 hypothetical protein Ccar_01705 [Clostridium carboxidivorans P7]EET88655.1 hypothetical protein CcarbDRAFT_0910 [Clostridium carboxidivorans P7]EFG89443.1 hypothetical protein CLCAR_0599 [Clostridium carboxidivorans P7]